MFSLNYIIFKVLLNVLYFIFFVKNSAFLSSLFTRIFKITQCKKLPLQMVFLFQSRKKKRLMEHHRMALFLRTETRPLHTSRNPQEEEVEWRIRNWKDRVRLVMESSQGGCCVITANIVSIIV